MAQITVTKPFSLNHEGALHRFDVGTHEVEDAIAGHWYVQAHTQQVGDVDESPEAVDETAAQVDETTAEADAKGDQGDEAPAKKKGK